MLSASKATVRLFTRILQLTTSSKQPQCSISFPLRLTLSHSNLINLTIVHKMSLNDIDYVFFRKNFTHRGPEIYPMKFILTNCLQVSAPFPPPSEEKSHQTLFITFISLHILFRMSLPTSMRALRKSSPTPGYSLTEVI